jgi:hypothetical protein
VIRNAYSSPQYRAIANNDTACQANLSTEQAVHANFDVVANHYQIIYLCSRTDSSRLQCATVDRRQRADLHIIANFNNGQGVHLPQ